MNELPNKELPKYCNNKDTDKSISENEAPSITEIKRGLKNMDLEEQEDADDENEIDYGLEGSLKDEENNFDSNRNYLYEQTSKNMQLLKKIDKLHQIITNYPLNTEVNLVINKLAPIITEKEVFEFVINTVKEKVNMVNLKNHPTVVHKHNYNFWTFSVDKETALKCLILEGKRFHDQTINLSLDLFEITQKDSSDDEIDMFSSDHLAERQSMEFPQIKDLTFKNGEDDFKINKKKKKVGGEEKKVIFRHIPKKIKEEKKDP